ncbi:MAG: riboflavin synthase [Opitutales bacterium]|nr:riboflavin synthase [Opitutales bacterium]
MFTGLVEETGRVVEIVPGAGDSVRMTLETGIVADGLSIGDSVAVNGCCLTAVAIEGRRVSFDLLGETVRVTSFHDVKAGSLVNLERSLAVGQRMGGHFVTGHIDGVGIVRSLEREGDDYVIRVQAPAELRKYLVYKGSVSIDGISLTVAGVEGDSFHVCLIPHTMEVTNLHTRKAGDRVNLESDMLAKYVERIIEARGQ